MGKVYLVGAGPGDPDLLTIKALRCIQRADVILYDRLVNRELLKEAKPEADLVFCGKLPKLHIMKQETINYLLVKYGKQGKTVVRLKGGDPFVYGRGAEEALVLAENGVAYEVVPGITAGIAAPAYAGIPITHRDLGNSFAVVTGHCKKGMPNEIKWDHLANAVDTIAIYMGIGHLPQICQQLILHGKSKDTPIAIIQQGTTDAQRTVVGTLDTIVTVVKKEQITNPAMIVVGEVVRFRERINKIIEQQTNELLIEAKLVL
ncbi:uroporphyrinogen-III C-methyltransferase [Aquibacillus salsiterrae]|uniref:Uroporphyrinogen-III C-methyltransferase n=1 Tax=Aquibacillus salsiterrae TaxID=2950439 RepID=A0A9X3WJX1_9BACI|nr:uroporphyrinogen-III C-methyltransferase [Aquibacillus salsiterrae]MDC3418441.1 uroporphyrinogen-III C-methyltransferase [Aquibacillus salsiterrae]